MKLIPKNQNAFSLTEVCLALGIAAFCLVALFGLLPVGVNSNKATVEQTMAAGVATNVVADLRQAAAGASSSLRYGITLSPTQPAAPQVLLCGEDGTPITLASTGNTVTTTQARYRVTIDLTKDVSTQLLWTRVRVSWPPVISLVQGNSVKPAGVIDVMTAINPNL